MKRAEEKKTLLPILFSGPLMHGATSLPLRYVGTYRQGDDNNVFKQFPLELWPVCPVLADQALLNTNSKLFFWRMTGVFMVKTEFKCILSHVLKNRCPTEPIRYKLICKQNLFCYLVFGHILWLTNPNHFHFLFFKRSEMDFRHLK